MATVPIAHCPPGPRGASGQGSALPGREAGLPICLCRLLPENHARQRPGVQLGGPPAQPPPSPRHRRRPSAQMGPVFPWGLAGTALSTGSCSDLHLGLLPGAVGGFPTFPRPLISMLSCRACSRVADPLNPGLLRATTPPQARTATPSLSPSPHPTLPPPPALRSPQCGLPLQAAQRLLWGSRPDGRWLQEQLF